MLKPPSSWRDTFTALGFRRVKRRRKPNQLRPRRASMEPLEGRLLMAFDTAVDPLDPAYADLAGIVGTEVVATTPKSEIEFVITDPEAAALFRVDTVFDEEKGLRAVLRLVDGVPANQKGLYEFQIALQVGSESVADYNVAVLFPDSDMVDAIHDDRAQAAQAIVTAQSGLDASSILAKIETDGSFDDLPLITLEEPVIELPVPELDFVISDQPEGEEIVDEVVEVIGPRIEVIEQVKEKVDRVIALTNSVMDATDGVATVAERIKAYASLGRVSDDVVSEKQRIDEATMADSVRRLGAAFYLLTDQFKADMGSADPALAAAAKEAFETAYAQADLYFTGWSGKGVNSPTYKTERPDRGEDHYSVWYESGEADLTDLISVNLGRTTMVQIAVPQSSITSPARLANISTDTTFDEATGGYYLYNGQSSVGNTQYLQVMYQSNGQYQADSYVKFNISDFGLTSQEVTSASVTLKVSSRSGTTQDSAKVLPSDEWNQTYLPWVSRPLGVGPATEPWTPPASSGTVTIDVTEAVRREVRMGDMDFSGAILSNLADFEAFELFVRDEAAYHTQYDIRTAIPDNVATALHEDILYRGDANYDGAVNRYDTGRFLKRIGKRHGDMNFDSYVDIFDVNIVSAGWNEADEIPRYSEGNANLDGDVDIFDVNVVSDNWAPENDNPPPLSILPASLALRLYQTSGSGSAAYWADANSTTPPPLSSQPKLTINQKPDLIVKGFSANGEDLTVTYLVTHNNGPLSNLTPFDIGIYRSANGTTNDQQMLSFLVNTNTLDTNGANARAPGLHTVVIPLNAAFDANDPDDEDYYLRVKLDNGPTTPQTELSESNNEMLFEGGAFVGDDGTLHVHGTDASNSIQINAASVVFQGSTPKTYTVDSQSVDNVVVRAHGGADTVVPDSVLTLPLVVHGGAGDDTLHGALGDDVLLGGAGQDMLHGLSGEDRYTLPRTTEADGDRVYETEFEQIDSDAPWTVATTVPSSEAAAQAIAVDGAGNSIHVWRGNPGSGNVLLARRFDALGQSLGEAFTVVNNADAIQPRVSANASGDFVIAWEEKTGSGPRQVRYRRYSPLGDELVAGEVVLVASDAQSTTNANSAIVLHDDGSITITWQASAAGGGNTDVYFQRFDAEDAPALENPGIVTGTTAAGNQRLGISGRSLAVSADGTFAITWIEDRQVFVRRFDAEGVATGATETVLATADTPTNTVIGDAAAIFEPTGELLITWWQQTPNGPSLPTSKIQLRRFDAGAWQSIETLVDFTSSDWTSPSASYGPPVSSGLSDLQLAVDNNGHLAIAWTHAETAAQEHWSFVQWFTTAGEPIALPSRLNATTAAEAARGTSIASNSAGRFVAAWSTAASFVGQPMEFIWAPTPTTGLPTLLTLPVQLLGLGSSIADLQLEAVYPGGVLANVVIEEATTNPAGVSITMIPGQPGKAHLDWTPAQGTSAGVYLINVDVRDAANPALKTRAIVRVAYGVSNQAPVLAPIANQSVIVGETLSFQLAATDADGTDLELRYTMSGDYPPGAYLNPVTGAFRWTPTAQDVDTHTFNLVVSDRGLPAGVDTQPISITVLAPNIAPSFSGPTSVSFNEDTTYTFSGSGNVVQVADADNASGLLELTIVATSGKVDLNGSTGLTFNVGDANQQRLVKVRGTAANLNAALSGMQFVPDANAYGAIDLRLELSDLGNGGTHPVATATQIVTLNIARVVDSPSISEQDLYLLQETDEYIVVDDIFPGNEVGTIGKIAATNPDPDMGLTYEIDVSHEDTNASGAVLLDPITGILRLRNRDALPTSETPQIRVRVYYALDSTKVAGATITIHEEPESNSRPSAQDNTYTVSEGATITGNLITDSGGAAGTDSDDGAIVVDSIQVGAARLPVGVAHVLQSGATLTVQANGSFSYDTSTSSSFDANHTSYSLEFFSYTIADIHGARSSAYVTVTINHVNDAPTVKSGQVLSVEPHVVSGTVVGNVLVLHSEPLEGLTYSITSGNINQAFEIDNQGQLTVDVSSLPASPSQYTLAIKVMDSASNNDTKSVTVNVQPNSVPQVPTLNYQTPEDVPLFGNLLTDAQGHGSAIDPDSDAMSIVAVAGQPVKVGVPIVLSTGATITVSANGSFVYDPTTTRSFERLSLDTSSVDGVSVTVRDSRGADVETMLLVKVLGRDDATIAADNSYGTLTSEVLHGNLIQDPSSFGIDSDADANDVLAVVAVDGSSVSGTTATTITTVKGATVKVFADGSFEYNPKTLTELSPLLPAGTVIEDVFSYTISDGIGAGTSTAVARISVLKSHDAIDAQVRIDDFGLVDDNGVYATDRKSSDARVQGTIVAGDLVAHHFVVEFEKDATSMAAPADGTLQVTPSTTGFPNFEYDLSSIAGFSTGAKAIAYRVVAYDASNQVIDESFWRRFDFDFVPPINQGPVRLEHSMRLFYDSGQIESPLTFVDQFTYNPTLIGDIYGDFNGKHVRIDVTHTRGGVPYSGFARLTSAGRFTYDPRGADPGMAELTSVESVQVVYDLVLETPGNPALDVTILSDQEFDFQYSKSPGSLATLSIDAISDDKPEDYDLGARVIRGSVTGVEDSQVTIELDYADAQGNFDNQNVVIDARFGPSLQGDSEGASQEFAYTARGLHGASPKVRARVREWDLTAGMYIYTDWHIKQFSTATAPDIDSLDDITITAGSGQKPTFTGYLTGALAGSTPGEGSIDLASVGFVTVQFFHTSSPLTGASVPDGTAITDAQGTFDYTATGLFSDPDDPPGFVTLQARTVVTLPDSTQIVGTPETVHLTVLEPALPTISAAEFEPLNIEAATPGPVSTGWGWTTADPRLTGVLTQNVPSGIDVSDVRLEFVHDTPGTSSDDELVVGYSLPDSQGRFTYLPVNMPTGDVRVRARVVYYDRDLNANFSSATWTNLWLHVNAATNALSTIEDLTVLNIVGMNGAVPIVNDVKLTGHIEDPEGYEAFVTIEFFEGAVLRGSTVTDASGNFTYTVPGLSTGQRTIQVKAKEWNFITQSFESGTASPITFELAAAAAYQVASFALHSDTGSSSSDGDTANPLVFGKISGGGSLAGVRVAIDWGDNASVDAEVVTDSEGYFSYRPTTLDYGDHNVHAFIAGQSPTSGMTTGTFTYEQQANLAAAIIASEFHLADLVASPIVDPAIVGRIRNEGSVSGVTIELDYDSNDGNGFNATTTTDALGMFRFTPDVPAGQTSIRARTREWDPVTGKWLTSDFTNLAQFPFNYQPVTITAPALASVQYRLSGGPEIYGVVSGSPSPSLANELVVEFRLSELGPVIGTTTVAATTGAYSFLPTGFVAGSSYTVWAQVKRTSGSETVYGTASHTTPFTYTPDPSSAPRVDSFALVQDTATGTSTATDGSTSNDNLVGSIAGFTPLASRTVQFDWNSDDISDAQVTTDANGGFVYDPNLSSPGYYSVRARAVTGTSSYTAWRRLSFVYDSNDSSPQALALVQAFAAINPSWQTASEGFDHDSAAEAAEALYKAKLANADSSYDFSVAMAKLARDAAQLTADNAYEVARLAAEASYQAAIVGAQNAFTSAINALPEEERASYDLRDFVWPTAPDDNRLVIPDASQQPTVPPARSYDGPSFDYTLSPTYRAGVANAERQYTLDVKAARQAYHNAIDPVLTTYQEDVADAYEQYNIQLDEARELFEELQLDGPEFNQAAYDELIETIRKAWEDYDEATRELDDEFNAATAAAYSVMHEAMDLTRTSEDSEHQGVDENFQELVNPTADNFDDAASDHYEINKNYSPKYERILNEYSRRYQGAVLTKELGRSAALHAVTVTVTEAQAALAKLQRDFNHLKFADQVADGAEWAKDLADARRTLEQDLADAVLTRDHALADKARVRDGAMAEAVELRDETISEAKFSAFQAWNQQANSPWSNYQLALAQNERAYDAQLRQLALERDQQKSEAVKLETKATASAVNDRTYARAAAERNRAVDLSAELRDYQIVVDAKYTSRDNELTDAWKDYRIVTAQIDNDRAIPTAEANHKYAIAADEVQHAFVTAYAWADSFGFHTYYVTYWGYTHGFGSDWPWSYDVPNYIDQNGWVVQSGYQVDNADTRDSLLKTYRTQSAQVTRDYYIAMAGINEEFDLIANEAREAYRLETNRIFHESVIDVSNARYDYQVDVAVVQDTYNVAIATAAANYAVGLARAEADHLFLDAEADAAFDLGESTIVVPFQSQDFPRSVADAKTKAAFEFSQADAYVSDLTSWIGGSPTPWKSYQLALAVAERTRVEDLGTADVNRASYLAGHDADWTEAIVSAELQYAIEIYGDLEEEGAYVARADTIASAQLELALTSPLVDYVTAAAGAHKEHDQGIADEDLAFFDAVVIADADRDEANIKAFNAHAKAVANATYEHARPGGITTEEYNDALAEAQKELNDSYAKAYADRAHAVTDARIAWTNAMGSLNLELVVDLVRTQQDWAQYRRSEIVGQASAVSSGQNAYDDAVAEALERQTVAFAQADATYNNLVAGVEAAYAVDVNASQSAKASDDAIALGAYEVALHNAHKVAAASTYTAASTPLNLYRKKAAEADYDWAVEQANARNLYHQNSQNPLGLVGVNAAQTVARNTSDLAHTARTTAATLAHAIDQAAADRALELEVASGGLYVRHKTAEANLMLGAVDVQAELDIANAKAAHARGKAYAAASEAWLNTMIDAQLQRELQLISFDQYDAILEEASKRRQDARKAADKEYERALDESGVTAHQQVGALRIQYVIDNLGGSGEGEVTNQVTPSEKHAIATAQNDLRLTTALARSEEIHQGQLLAIDYDYTVAKANLDVAFQQELRDAGSDRAKFRAEAEADFNQQESAAESLVLQSLSGANPNDQELIFRAAEAAARAAWFQYLATPAPSSTVSRYAVFRQGLAAADGQQDVDLTIATGAQQVAQAQESQRHGQKIAAHERQRTIDRARVEGASSVQAVRNERLAAGPARWAEQAHAVARVTALVDYDLRVFSIYRNEDLTAPQRTEKLEDAAYARDVAYANADFDWRLEIAEGEFAYTVAEAAREKAHLADLGKIERTFSHYAAQFAAERDVAFARAERQYQLDSTAADNAERSARATATANFNSAQHAGRVDAMNVPESFFESDPLPWAGYARDRAFSEQQAWEAVKDDYLSWQGLVNAAYTTYAGVRANAYLTSAQSLANSARTFEQQSAALTQQHVAALAGYQQAFDEALAELVVAHREAVAQAERTLAVRVAEANRDGAPTTEAYEEYEVDLDAANLEYQEEYHKIDRQRRQAFAQSGFDLARDTSALYDTAAGEVATAEALFESTVAGAYYTASTQTQGLEETLAQLAYAFNTLDAQTFADQLDDLATNNESPWAVLAAAQADARRTEIVDPLATLERTQRGDLADAENTYRAALGGAGRTRWLAEAGADVARALADSGAALALAVTGGLTGEQIKTPTELAPPIPDTGSVPWIASVNVVGWPWYGGQWAGWIDDGWYDAALLAGGWGSWGTWYGQWGWAWGYSPYYAGGYGAWGYYGFGGYYGYGYGYQTYYPGWYGWAGWNPSYLTPPSGLSGDFEVDVKGLLAEFEYVNASMTAHRDGVEAIITKVKDQTPPTVNESTGAAQLGNPPAQTPSAPPPPPPEGGGGAGGGELPKSGSIKIPVFAGGRIAAVSDNGGNWSGIGVSTVLKALAPKVLPFFYQHFSLAGTSYETNLVFSDSQSTVALLEVRDASGKLLNERTFAPTSYNPGLRIRLEIPRGWSDFEAANYILEAVLKENSIVNLSFVQWAAGAGIDYTDAFEDWRKAGVQAKLQEAAEFAKNYYLTVVSFVPGGSAVAITYNLDQGDYKGAALEALFMGPVLKFAGAGIAAVAIKAGDKLEAVIPVSLIAKFKKLPADEQARLLEKLASTKSGDEALELVEKKLGISGSRLPEALLDAHSKGHTAWHAGPNFDYEKVKDWVFTRYREYLLDGGKVPNFAKSMSEYNHVRGGVVLGRLDPKNKALEIFKGGNLATMVEELAHYEQAKLLDVWGKRKFNQEEIDDIEAAVEGVLKALGFVPAPKQQLGRSPF